MRTLLVREKPQFARPGILRLGRRGSSRMDAKYLGEIERGWHTPSIATTTRIAEGLGISVADLVRDL